MFSFVLNKNCLFIVSSLRFIRFEQIFGKQPDFYRFDSGFLVTLSYYCQQTFQLSKKKQKKEKSQGKVENKVK